MCDAMSGCERVVAVMATVFILMQQSHTIMFAQSNGQQKFDRDVVNNGKENITKS